ncbi:MAG: MmgE/PrpD family protein [Deltaproteobacteria bacterium]|jgi:2-methylcitrate dehydratase PrpD|nr:MmgE/PrpD family protein [Deltaproteobacteria bacterium]
MNESAILAEHAANTVYEDLPAKAVEMTKMSLLDALGVTLAAGGLCPECEAFVEIAMETGGKNESTILGFGAQVPAHMAAFANGAMAHALDFEDAHDLALVHPNAAAVPAALATAESIGNVNGKDFITALAVGCDIVCRLGLAFNENPGEYGWYIPPILGSFGAAAAAGKLLNLDETGILDAFSLTLCQSTCSAELRYSPHSDIRSVRDAFAAQAGVLAARLAHKGVKGFDQPFEGKAGLFNLYARGNYDRLQLIKGLGTRFEGAHISFKPWPACRGTHTYIEAALHILSEHALDFNDIEAVRVIVSAFNRMLCEPEHVKKAPQTVIDAKFSIPFTVATALYHQEVGLAHFTPEGLKDQNVLQLAQKIRYELDASLGLRDATRGFLEIKTKDNRTYVKRIDQAYGHPDNPISQKAVVAKFMECAAKARTKIPPKKLKAAVKSILALEEIEDIRQVATLL